MPSPTLAQAVDQWVHTTQTLPDASLELPWDWGAYDEGLRLSFFRVYEELRKLSANLLAERTRTGQPITAAQRALGLYHVAWHDLQGVLLGISDDVLDQPPAEGEWSIRQTLKHIFRVPRNFYCQTHYGLTEYRAGRKITQTMPDEEISRFLGHTWDDYEQKIISSTRAEIFADYEAMHTRLLQELCQITEAELNAPTIWWEEYEVPIQFRLHRFDSHMRQHTIQIEKTLELLGLPFSESKRLNRHIYNALGECEGMRIGAWDAGDAQVQPVAEGISSLAGEIAQIIA